MKPTPESTPRLRPGCRLGAPPSGADLLLVPEGALRLTGPAPAIVALCDGARTFAEIVDALAAIHPGAPRERIEDDAGELLVRLRDRRALDF